MKTSYKIFAGALTLALTSGILSSCTDDFLKPDPLSMYEPEKTFNTEAGLRSAITMCDKHLRNYWTGGGNNNILCPIGSEYMYSDLALYGRTDAVGGVYGDFANALTPTNGISNGDDNRISHFWYETYNGIKYANTVLTYIDGVQGLSEAVKNEYKGRAYFHRAFRYLSLVFEFGDVPLITKILSVPKQNYRSTKKAAILKMITADMEKAVQWVPDQKDMQYYGMVNKGACRMLLAKCYLATGQWQKAEEQCNELINNSGYSLMTQPFGQDINSGEPETWNITRNVIWDLHRPENKLANENKEAIFGLTNTTLESYSSFNTMRIFGPYWSDNARLKTPDGAQAGNNFARNNALYDKQIDNLRAFGRGIATVRPTFFAQHTLWEVNGMEDKQDLRHNSQVGNWVNMEDLKYNAYTDQKNKTKSAYYGQHYRLYQDGKILCQDTLRDWFDFPLYKIYLKDQVAEENLGAVQFNGSSKGSNANWYVYRLAEAYLLRAEARFYQGKNAEAREDLNTLRRRAHCSQFYTGNITIGDIVNERARELYLEEWRRTELTRISYCLALSGKPDEWGNTYNINTWDKQEGTDTRGGSYWYQRIVHYSYYNKFPNGITSGPNTLKYTMDKHNVYYPIPNDAITANNKGTLWQNYGYDGYNPNIKEWDNWEDAVADEDKIN